MEITLSRRNVLKIGTAATVIAIMGKLYAEEPNELSKVNDLVASNFADAFKDGKYVLPNLPYDYNALEPLYDEQALKIHHDKHHAGYVNKLNEAISKLDEARKTGNYSSIKALSNELAFNGSGHILHTLFWHSMKPGGNKGQIPDELKKSFEEHFGSAKNAQEHFAAAAKAVEGSGWAILAFEPVSQKLLVLQCEKHQNLTIWGVIPLLVCDVWEHAYYLKYQNDRPQWVDNFMKLANWDFASKKLAETKTVMKHPK